jgi:hypothetical protein
MKATSFGTVLSNLINSSQMSRKVCYQERNPWSNFLSKKKKKTATKNVGIECCVLLAQKRGFGEDYIGTVAKECAGCATTTSIIRGG